MRPFFRYYGSKYRDALIYGQPRRPVVCEPFAGSLGFSVRWSDHIDKVIAVEKYKILADLWKFLISASYDDIMDIPVDITSINEVGTGPERWLVSFWLGKGDSTPRYKRTPSMMRLLEEHNNMGVNRWTKHTRQSIANQIHLINNWEIIHGDYYDAPDGDFHYHVDPPYRVAGLGYKHGSSSINYKRLAEWCKSKEIGEVCESEGHGEWLPFKELFKNKTQANTYKWEFVYRMDQEGLLFK